MKKLLAVVAILVLGVPLLLLLLSSAPELTVVSPVRVIGTATPVAVRVESPHGVRRVTAELEQNDQRYRIFESVRPARRVAFLGKNEPPSEIRFSAGKAQAPALHDGKARLIVEAQANDFRAATGTVVLDVDVNTQPPQVTADGVQHYINQGGAELVTFTVSGYWTEAGVRVGPYTFRSFPLPGRSGERFSIFAFPWDVPADTVPIVYASNPSGAEAKAHFWLKVFPKKFRARDLELTDAFIGKVTDEIDPNGTGDKLQRFLKINGDLRRQNNQTLADLRLKTEERMLWSGPFWRYGKTESEFADHRAYVYHGKVVDHQTHLGFDLSDVQHAPVVAANDGRVVFAARLGIYGNCIVVDHGYGLQSIYGHLSQLAVKPGDIVKRGQEMGRSGETGLAGGDHLHFSMQVDGVQITPVEWWDEHWIKDRILSKVAGKS
ncbi:MAG: M23 family metallopeptidase [Bryobacteraceae bacterium]|jgi:murein DD-endopeptidase MepM/ murein hydrolase activator NlpD